MPLQPPVQRHASNLSWALDGDHWDGQVQRFNPLYDHAAALAEAEEQAEAVGAVLEVCLVPAESDPGRALLVVDHFSVLFLPLPGPRYHPLQIFRFDPATRTFFELDDPAEAPADQPLFVRVCVLSFDGTGGNEEEEFTDSSKLHPMAISSLFAGDEGPWLHIF